MPHSPQSIRYALERSIKHWEENAAIESIAEADIRASSCALCSLFLRPSNPAGASCLGCPVFRATGVKYCRGTPYSAASKAHDEGDLSAWQEAAKRELEFLRSLLAAMDQTNDKA